MSYANALRKLESLPLEEQEFAAGLYVFSIRGDKTHCGCAVGKLLPELDRRALFGSGVNYSGVTGLLTWINQPGALIADMSVTELRALQYANDNATYGADGSNGPESRKKRYRLVIEWLRAQVANELTEGNAQ